MGLLNYAQCIVNIYCDLNWAFSLSCENGHLDVAQWIISLKESQVNSPAPLEARLECLAVASTSPTVYRETQLIQVGESIRYTKIDIHAHNEWAFIESCGNGHLNVAQWLIQLGEKTGYYKIDIHAHNDWAWMRSCINGHLDVAQWLIQLGESNGYTKIDIHAEHDYAFIGSCRNGHLDVAQWLVHLGDNGYGSYTTEQQEKLKQLTD